MERKTNKCESFHSFLKQMLHQKRMGKFDSRVDKGILVGYSSTMKSYKC